MLMVAALLTTIMSADSGGAPVRSRTFESIPAATTARDEWLGEDKFKHFAMSYAITAFGFAGARSLLDSDASAALAVAAGVTAGLLKEFYDRSRDRPFSSRDLVWDAAGVAIAFLTVRQTWK